MSYTRAYTFKMLTDADVEDHYNPCVYLLEIEKRENDSCGFHLTRSKWDPYPWISWVDRGSAAHQAGLQSGDCVLQVNGDDIVGQRVSEVAQLVRANPTQVSLLLWNAGVNGQCSPEALCCGPMPNNLQKLSACMSSILAFLECPVCLDTTTPPTYQCDNGHLICMRCRVKSERCPVCRIRFTRGRSLLADQVYNAITDAFELREESHEVRSAKIQQIFKLKKNKNVPGIKVTQAHTNKFLARLIGKSSSVDNLSSKNDSRHHFLTVDSEFCANLKTKSLSTNEIFHPESPTISRNGSTSSLNRNKIRNATVSFHGSFENLDKRIHDVSINQLISFPSQNSDGVLYHCPYKRECASLIKGADIIQHFQQKHDGPLIQYFKSKIKLSLQNIHESYILFWEDHVFFLKIIYENYERGDPSNYRDTRLWVWLLGSKKQSSEFQLHINLLNKLKEETILLSIKSAVYSLSSVSWSDIKESKKGVYISSETLNAICNTDALIEIEILKYDMAL